MRQHSERQQLLRNLFFMYVIEFEEDLASQLLYPEELDEDQIWEELFLSNLAELSDLLAAVINTRYLIRPLPSSREEYDIARLFQTPDYIFKQALRTTKSGFIYVFNNISTHEVFAHNSPLLTSWL